LACETELVHDFALIGASQTSTATTIGEFPVNTALPLAINAVGPEGERISHEPTSPDIILQPGVYSVEYSASTVEGKGENVIPGVQLRLNGEFLPLTSSFTIANDTWKRSQTLAGGGIITVTEENSVLNLVTIVGTILFTEVVSIRIFDIPDTDYGLIGNVRPIGAVPVNTAIPLVNAIGPVGPNISHELTDTDILLQPGVYSVEYSADPVYGNPSTTAGVQLRLNGTLIPLTDSFLLKNAPATSTQILAGGGIVNVTEANSVLNLVTILGDIHFSGIISIRIFKIPTNEAALIGFSKPIGGTGVAIPLPFSLNAVGPIGTNIAHEPSSPNIILQPGVYSVEYSAAPVDSWETSGVQLRLNGTLLPLTNSYIVGADSPALTQSLVGGGIVNVTEANSVLNLVTIRNWTNFVGYTSVRIVNLEQ
ncbi:hypothetical protein, partial [Bacillus cereus]|uniref:hypothetical protein n=1 Tax=Bacillus cereus TaxID=1396 RepID=UPI000BEC59DB